MHVELKWMVGGLMGEADIICYTYKKVYCLTEARLQQKEMNVKLIIL